jgi:hypothetical protein
MREGPFFKASQVGIMKMAHIMALRTALDDIRVSQSGF